jgi:hypothetical protein
MSKKKIYVASPYTHDDTGIRRLRAELVTYIGVQIIKEGHMIWGPITESDRYATHGLEDTDWEFWKEHDLSMLDTCEELWVICLGGWKESVGVRAEIQHAADTGKVIRYVDPYEYLPRDLLSSIINMDRYRHIKEKI